MRKRLKIELLTHDDTALIKYARRFKTFANLRSHASHATIFRYIQESTTQQPLTLFEGASIQGETFNISVNALNESSTLSLHSPKSKKARHFISESDSD